MGEDLAYFNFDLNYHDPNWAQDAKAIEDYLHGRGIEFGMFYRGDETDTTDAQWVAKAEERFVAYEVIAGGHPDRAIFQSWHPHPEHLLPESDPSTFTYLIDRYLRKRTALTLEAPSDSTPSQTIAGTLADADGSPLEDAVVEIHIAPLEGPGLASEYTITGTVPDGAIQADVGYRVNTECDCSGVGDFSLYEVRYTEGSGGSNLVPNGNFARAWEGWGAWGDGAWELVAGDLGSGTALHVTAQAGQPAAINSGRFAVSGGVPFTVTFLARVSPETQGSGYFDLIFLDASQELRRFMIPLETATANLGQARTDSSGGSKSSLTRRSPVAQYSMPGTPGTKSIGRRMGRCSRGNRMRGRRIAGLTRSSPGGAGRSYRGSRMARSDGGQVARPPVPGPCACCGSPDPMRMLLKSTNFLLGGVGRPLQLGDVDLAHLQHRLHCPSPSLGVGIARQLVQAPRNDLPGKAVSVLEPAALARFAAVSSEGVP